MRTIMAKRNHRAIRRLSAALMAKVAPGPEPPLRYVRADAPGISRRRRGKSFVYLRPDGRPLQSAADLARIRALAIPPAWTDVCICPDPQGHIQATGRDARGRKQYRYHARWNLMRNENKFGRMVAFGKLLPRIRARTRAHLRLPGLPREKVLALVVRLLEETMIRIGNREYRKANRSFGLTTLHDRHVAVHGGKARFRFRGKSGKEHTIDLDDARLARLVKQCRDIPGQELFQYIGDDGKPQTIGSGDVNDYLREISGQELTAKDFRTWGGTVLAAQELVHAEPARSQAEAKRSIARGIERVAASSGTPPPCASATTCTRRCSRPTRAAACTQKVEVAAHGAARRGTRPSSW
jgi:DNA topoisomerase-1